MVRISPFTTAPLVPALMARPCTTPGFRVSTTLVSVVQLAAHPSPPKVLQWMHVPLSAVLGPVQSLLDPQAKKDFAPPWQIPLPVQSASFVQAVPALVPPV